MTVVNAIYSEFPLLGLTPKASNDLGWKVVSSRGKQVKGKQVGVSIEDTNIIQGLRSRDEKVFVNVIERYHSNLLRLAMIYVHNQAVAEEVVQETWLGVLEGIHRFEGRSSFKTWLFQILINRAKTRGVRERRYVPFPDGLGSHGDDQDEPTIDPGHFYASGSRTNYWMVPPLSWDEYSPERLLLSKETFHQIEGAIQLLPAIQKKVIIFRDVEGLSSAEVCQLLDISETNQRVLLHRARSKVRRTLEQYLEKNVERN